VAGCTYTNAWTITSGPVGWAFSSTTAYNPSLTVTQSGTYTIQYTMSSPGCNCTMVYTQTVTVNLPAASFTLPSPICAGTAVPFSAAGGQPHYLWNFGDGYTSTLNPATHTFSGTPANPTVSLTVTDAFGCSSTVSQPITVLPMPVIAITPNQFICPGNTATITATSGFSNYQWYHNGTMVQNSASNTYTSGNMGTYWVVASNGSGCSVKSAVTHIFYYTKPIADIQGSSTACIYGSSGNIYLSNSSNDAPGTTYSWWLSGGTATPTTNYDLNVSINTPGTYTFILTATSSDGCIAKDTFCVVASAAPTVTVTPSASGTLCAGSNYCFTANAAPAGPAYIYSWSNGASGTTMCTSAPGMYFVKVTNPLTGCVNNQFAGIINPRPNTILFPIGCDTLCDTAKIIPPLPLGGGLTWASYTIQWYEHPTPNIWILISPQPTPQHILPLSSLSPGQHNISIIVTNSFGCKDTSNVYNLYIKHCGDCNCDKSNWGELYWQYNEALQKQAPPPSAKNAKAIPTGATPFKCGDYLSAFDCKKPITINASYTCNPDSCSQVVKYILTGTDINGPVNQSGNMAFSTTGLLQGSYTLTMIGKCGDSVCKECVIKFDIKCDSVHTDCCKGSVWEGGTPWYYFDATGAVKEKIDCAKGTTIVLSGNTCKLPLVIGANIICPTGCQGNVTVTVKDGGGNIVQTGAAPLTITGLPNGTYTVEINGYCGGVLCLTCKLVIKVNCPACDCKGSKWGDKTIAIGGAVKKLNCPGEYTVKCNQPITINASYICADAACPGTVTYKLVSPTGITTGALPVTFTPNTSGIYTLTLYGLCGGKICDSCVVTFKTDCPPPPCCPYNISIKDPVVTTSTLANPPATVVNASFGISGTMIPSGAPITGNLFTEIRAEVVSYALYDNYGGECINCKSYPYTWASMYQPGSVSGVNPAITMYNSTSPSFNPAGNGMYQNPREVVWSSSNPFALPANVNLSFLLPAASIIQCCELTAKICVKFTFRDISCKECEVVVCFPVTIKPGGGNPPPPPGECICSIKPVITYEGGSQAVKCTDFIQLFKGNIPVTLNPNFTCTDATGKPCKSSINISVYKNSNLVAVLTGPLYSYTFLVSGQYDYVITANCGGKQCDVCRFSVKIP
jgi:PKD repeat protein